MAARAHIFVFPFPFVHHQLHDRKVGQLLTVETRTLILAVVGHYTRYRWSCLKRILNVERILKVTKKSGNRERDVGCCLYETAVLFSMVFFGQRYKIWFQSLVRHLFNLWNQHVMTRETILLLIIILRKSPSKEEILRLEAVIILISFHY